MGVNDDDLQELEELDTLSLTDFVISKDRDSDFHDHNDHEHKPRSPATEDFFEFYRSGSIGLSQDHIIFHAGDIISGGKLIPINPNPETLNPNEKHISRRRCESMRELKSSTNKGTAARLARNSFSFDQKKVNQNSRSSNATASDMMSNRNSLSTKSSSSRWSEVVFGQLKGPPEMDLKDIRNRQIVRNTSKSLFGDQRKTTWGVLGFLSCKKSGSVAVTMP